MEESLKVNTKLFDFNGAIGRLDFFYNFVISNIIEMAFALPFFIWHFSDIKNLFISNYGYFEVLNSPLVIKALFLIGISISLIIKVSNIYRRLNDIRGKVNNTFSTLCTIPYIFLSYSFLFGDSNYMLFFVIAAISITLFLYFKKGAVTSKLPYDFKHEFNWGAFFGTWIWGLFNKTYITLLHLLLFLTPFGIYFRLICGIKGNEWAYKNKKCDDLNKFKIGQKRQGVIFGVLSLVVFPLITYILLIIIGVNMLASDLKKVKTDPNYEPKIVRFSEKYFDITKSFFERYTIEEDSNNFYISLSDWRKYSEREKRYIFSYASNIAAYERMMADKNKKDKNKSHSNHQLELKRTKIYSSTDGKLLGEYIFDVDATNSDLLHAFLMIPSAYRFY